MLGLGVGLIRGCRFMVDGGVEGSRDHVHSRCRGRCSVVEVASAAAITCTLSDDSDPWDSGDVLTMPIRRQWRLAR